MSKWDHHLSPAAQNYNVVETIYVGATLCTTLVRFGFPKYCFKHTACWDMGMNIYANLWCPIRPGGKQSSTIPLSKNIGLQKNTKNIPRLVFIFRVLEPTLLACIWEIP